MTAACVACGRVIPEGKKASWFLSDRWCWGCRCYVCDPCTLARGAVPPGPHDPSLHGPGARWPEIPSLPPPPDPVEERDPAADWDTIWPSYPVLTFDPKVAIMEAILENADRGASPTLEQKAADFEHLCTGAALFLVRDPKATPADLTVAKSFLQRTLARRKPSA